MVLRAWFGEGQAVPKDFEPQQILPGNYSSVWGPNCKSYPANNQALLCTFGVPHFKVEEKDQEEKTKMWWEYIRHFFNFSF